MRFSIMGYTVASAEQARSVMLIASLQGQRHIVAQCAAVIAKFEAAK